MAKDPLQSAPAQHAARQLQPCATCLDTAEDAVGAAEVVSSHHQTAQRKVIEQIFPLHQTGMPLQRRSAVPVNDDPALEREADVMGARALSLGSGQSEVPAQRASALPVALQAGIHSLTGMDMSSVQVHRNSPRPAQLNAHAYAQGQDIHLAPGQERHLPHEAWHVVQQAQGRVRPTTQMKRAPIDGGRVTLGQPRPPGGSESASMPVQRALVTDGDILGQQRNGNFSWESFRGQRVDAIDGTAKEDGRGATISSNGAMAKTQVRWGAIDPGCEEGTSMTATIGPDHNLGSTPSAANAVARVDALRKLSGQSYISGHLMNEKLGGPGNDGRNLTAISGSANTLQSSNIEKHVRDPVNNQGAWMHYDVQVAYADDQRICARASVGALRGTRAKGILISDIANSPNATVRVRYASALVANWWYLDQDGNPTGTAYSDTITIGSPLAQFGQAGNAQIHSGMTHTPAMPVAAARTTIDAESLVLTKSDLLKHIVESRAPLAQRIQALRQNIAALVEERDTAQDALAGLLQEMRRAGYRAGHGDGYVSALEVIGMAHSLAHLDDIESDEYREAYQEGWQRGHQQGEVYVAGYREGWHLADQGQPDRPSQHLDEFLEGFRTGYEHGRSEGAWAPGRTYHFTHGTSISNRDFQPPYETIRGYVLVEFTGQWIQSGGVWFEVVLRNTSDENYHSACGRNMWMKRSWLMKGL